MKISRLLLWFSLSLFLTACARNIYPPGYTAQKSYKTQLKKMETSYQEFVPVKLPLDSLSVRQWTAPSPNFNSRRPNLVILHHTAQESCEQSLKTLTDPATGREVSSHYLICKDGTVYQLVNELYRAWHAGVSRWGNISDVNSASIGIELDNNGNEPFSEKQISSLLVVLRSLKQRYHIPEGNFVGHADVAPARKQDPNIYFPWRELADSGYGYWQDSVLVTPPENFDCKTALHLIGYDISNLPAAITAFKRHFIQQNVSPVLTEEDKKVLYDIFEKYNR